MIEVKMVFEVFLIMSENTCSFTSYTMHIMYCSTVILFRQKKKLLCQVVPHSCTHANLTGMHILAYKTSSVCMKTYSNNISKIRRIVYLYL